MKNKKDEINSSLLDKAIIFAVHAHKNMERRGKGFPYIAHPLEAMSIVATMTNDQELLAAACLHDVLEDTDITYEELKEQFGERVADIVRAESDKVIANKSASDSWVERKEAAIAHLKAATREVKMVALGDKLSNMRALMRDYKLIGDELWNRFHVTDPRLHAWHYRGLADALSELEDTLAYQEFLYDVNYTFANRYDEFSFNVESDHVLIYGEINRSDVLKLKESLEKGKTYVFDFTNVFSVNFSGIRELLVLKDEGYSFIIRNASYRVAARFDTTGASNLISILKAPKEYTKADSLTQSGDGYTAVTYWTNDEDAMVKLYYEQIPSEEVEKEKRYSKEAMLLGIPTPLSGDLITVGNKKGLIFERILGKKSFARLIADNPSNIDEYAKEFALLSRKLHSTRCNKDVFPSAKDAYLRYAEEFEEFNDEERNVVKSFITNIEDKDTCLHGDFHIGNAIMTEDGQKLFIDMGDFSYGNPLFDLGTLWFVTHSKDEERTEFLYHTSNHNLYLFYQSFVKYYFDGKLSEEEADKIIRPFAALTLLLFSHKSGKAAPWMHGAIKEWLING